MNLLLVEDEEMAAKKLTKTLRHIAPEANVVAVTSSIRETVEWLRHYGSGHFTSPDLILMDIELADGQSFQIFEQITVKPPVIFTTSYDEYAIQAFRVNSIDYLLKPVQKDELRTALNKFTHQRAETRSAPVDSAKTVRQLVYDLQKQVQPNEYRNQFLVQYDNRLIAVETHQIAYFFAEDNLNQLQGTDGTKMIINYSLDELETMLDPAYFFRVNTSFIVSIRCVDQVHTYLGNHQTLRLTPAINKDIIISRERVMLFKEWLGK
ncbi:LytTR family DNA-binding domain-containing protein [Spirosoma humi]